MLRIRGEFLRIALALIPDHALEVAVAAGLLDPLDHVAVAEGPRLVPEVRVPDLRQGTAGSHADHADRPIHILAEVPGEEQRRSGPAGRGPGRVGPHPLRVPVRIEQTGTGFLAHDPRLVRREKPDLRVGLGGLFHEPIAGHVGLPGQEPEVGLLRARIRGLDRTRPRGLGSWWLAGRQSQDAPQCHGGQEKSLARQQDRSGRHESLRFSTQADAVPLRGFNGNCNGRRRSFARPRPSRRIRARRGQASPTASASTSRRPSPRPPFKTPSFPQARANRATPG